MTMNAGPTRRGVLGGAVALAAGSLLGPGRAQASPAAEDADLAGAGPGRVLAWGENSRGQLGRRVSGPRRPMVVSGLDEVVAVAAAVLSSYAIRADGSLWSWGEVNGRTFEPEAVPARVPGLPPIAAVSAYSTHALALAQDGSVWAWGSSNAAGQLGDGTTTRSATPVQVYGITDITSVHAGTAFSLALTQDGRVYSWGEGGYGQLGYYISGNPMPNARLIPHFGHVRRLAAGDISAFAVLQDGSALAWGGPPLGSPGSESSYRPVPVGGQVTAALDVAAGSRHSLFLTATHRIKGAGSNYWGELGLGDTQDREVPTLNPTLDEVTAIDTNRITSYALRRDRTVWAWGNNGALQLGQRSPDDLSTVPLQVPGVTGIRSIAAGGYHALALL